MPAGNIAPGGPLAAQPPRATAVALAVQELMPSTRRKYGAQDRAAVTRMPVVDAGMKPWPTRPTTVPSDPMYAGPVEPNVIVLPLFTLFEAVMAALTLASVPSWSLPAIQTAMIRAPARAAK